MHQSIATIHSPEFINLQPLDINPLMSSCEIKVLYLGENRNHSYISKEVATEMSKTLRGAPIVGYYKEENQDFRDHGHELIIDGDGLKSNCKTVPYGFVSPVAQVWFQKFNDYDDFGNSIEREYLMTTGYLWTGQFEECKCAVESNGRPHSMELDEKTLDGHWSENLKTGMDFFIINDAIFSKLCILGEDVEPCFEGSSVTAPNVSANFSLIDDNFKQTLFTMMKDLKFALEGGQEQMTVENTNTPSAEILENSLDNNEQSVSLENQVSTEGQNDSSFAAKEEDEKKKEDESTPEQKEEDDKKKEDEFAKKEDEEDKKDEEPKKDDEDDDKKKEEEDKFALLQEQYSALETQFAELKAENERLSSENAELVSFKLSVEDEKKDALINSFYMLADEDKQEVIEKKAEYSLDEIEAKLSVICVRKKVNFDLDETKEDETNDHNAVTTFNLDTALDSSVPAWIKAVKNTQKNRNNNI